ncbi:O-antigen ligase family protein [Lachnoclostridium phytofermentans]|uniref:O-antigen ligase family protein n=1 Tax=Lachnoclostridium phytofermentans TaxID=66219 RepID=UPI000495B077|nr:O-antigen ligase family protein [Lachnoclostridium phytofermentans]
MSNNLKKKRNNGYIDKKHVNTTSLMLLFPLFLIVTVLPLIVSMHSYSAGLGTYNWFPADDTAYDFFLYYKQWFFVFIAGLCLLILAIKSTLDKKFLKTHLAIYPLIGYAGLALISTIVSEHRSFGFSGIFEQFENVFCLLGYALVVYYSFLVLQSYSEIKLLINALAIGALILGIIGSFQAFGLDFFNTDLGKSLIAEKGVDPSTLEMAFEKGRTYATLYNPNYVGVYASMIIPLFIVLFLFKNKTYEYVLYGLVIITQAVSMFGSQSKTGLISIVVTAILALLLLRKILLRRWYIVLPIIASVCIGFIVINTIQNNAYLNAIKNAFSNKEEIKPNLSNMITTSDHIELTYKGNTLIISHNNDNSLIIKDTANNLINTEVIESEASEHVLKILDNRFDGISLVIFFDDIVDFGLLIDETPWYFKYNTETKQYQFYNRYGRFSPLESAPSMVFDGHETFGSGRGYLWSRTFPLLSDHIILGSGADTFVFEYPQYDYVAMTNYGFGAELITKPHSLYLQIGVQTGVLSLLCFMVFYGIYFFKSIVLYIRKKELNINDALGIAVLVSSFSYMVSGITNDSSITVAPIFWLLMGIGLAINRIVKLDSL